MRCLNRVTLLGRLVGVPDCRDGGGKPICNFKIETTEEWVSQQRVERRVVVHQCTAFGPVAVHVAKAAKHGWIYVEGALRDGRGETNNAAREIVCFLAIPVAEQEAA